MEKGRQIIAKRLDRALGDTKWLLLFTEAYVEVLARVSSHTTPHFWYAVRWRLVIMIFVLSASRPHGPRTLLLNP